MFLLIPFGILLVSLAMMAWIVGRKFVYLKKLNPDVVETVAPEQDSFWAEFFPGLAGHFQKTKITQYRLDLLNEFEKFLRKLRLFSLKVDSTTNKLIHRVRKSVVHHEGVISDEAAVQAEEETRIINSNNSKDKDWKEEEHKLILEIATSPKDAGLYKKLGNIYMKMDEWHDAVESFKKAVELDPEDERIRTKLEKASRKLKKLPT